MKATIKDILSYFNNPERDGGFWQPLFFEQFVSKENQIENLFDSIMRNPSLENFKVWRNNNLLKTRIFIGDYRGSLKVRTFYNPPNDKIKYIVIEGQDTLQSIYLALMGSYEGKEFYFNTLSGDIMQNDDILYQFKFLNIDEAVFPFVKLKDIVFSTDLINNVIKDIILSSYKRLTEKEKYRIAENIFQINNVFTINENFICELIDSVDNTTPIQKMILWDFLI